MLRLVIESDGGSRGNPGAAGCGTVVYAADHTTIRANIAEYLGTTTNNVAEYTGMINGLEAAIALGATHVDFFLDSKLVVSQMTGVWKCKNDRLRDLLVKAQSLVGSIGEVSFTWVPRRKNKSADKLANMAMDESGHQDPHILVLDRDEGGPDFDVIYSHLTSTGQETLPVDAPDEPEPEHSGADETEHEPACASRPADHGGEQSGEIIDLFTGWPDNESVVPKQEPEKVSKPVITRMYFIAISSDDDEASMRHHLQTAVGRLITVADLPKFGVPPINVYCDTTEAGSRAAVHVASLIGGRLVIEEGLNPMRLGRFDGRSPENCTTCFGFNVADMVADTSLTPPGGESYDACAARIGEAVAQIFARELERDDESDCVVVCSGQTIAAVLGNVVDPEEATAMTRMKVQPGSLSVVEHVNGVPTWIVPEI